MRSAADAAFLEDGRGRLVVATASFRGGAWPATAASLEDAVRPLLLLSRIECGCCSSSRGQTAAAADPLVGGVRHCFSRGWRGTERSHCYATSLGNEARLLFLLSRMEVDGPC